MEAQCVFCEVGREFINILYMILEYRGTYFKESEINY
jgi:hypothetical protein